MIHALAFLLYHVERYTFCLLYTTLNSKKSRQHQLNWYVATATYCLHNQKNGVIDPNKESIPTVTGIK